LIEQAITPQTTAIMPVHVYGNPCDTQAIQDIADRYGLAVIYDAAHAFGVKVNGESILNFGDMSSMSFHATKTYNTLEGGALVVKEERIKKRIDYLKNFGFADETTVVAPGINSKMDELRAAYGLLNLKRIDDAISKRKKIAEAYRELLRNAKGISYFEDIQNVKHNYSYFPIFVNEKEYGMSRDALYQKLKDCDIFCRRYFYPLISDFPMYKGLPSSAPERLPVARKRTSEVICLPIYAELEMEDVERVARAI
jgi:dTDP-4-amino-4,6-dideoxygalactose transaminase